MWQNTSSPRGTAEKPGVEKFIAEAICGLQVLQINCVVTPHLVQVAAALAKADVVQFLCLRLAALCPCGRHSPPGWFWLRFAVLSVPPSRYGANTMRKWLMIKVLQQSAFFRIFPLTSQLICYIIGCVW
jgi:hypothetical protein